MPSRLLMLVVLSDRRRDAEEAHGLEKLVRFQFARSGEGLGCLAVAPAHVRAKRDMLDAALSKFPNQPIHRRHVSSPVSDSESTTARAAQVAA